jgi:cytochrome c2
VPGSQMDLKLPDQAEREDVIAYLRSVRTAK